MSDVNAPLEAAAWLSDDLLLTVMPTPPTQDGSPLRERRFEPPDGGRSIAVVSDTADIRNDAVVDLRTLLLEHAAPWPADVRNRFVAFLASSLADPYASDALADTLRFARDVLRERLPLAVLQAGAPRLLHVERLHRVADRAFYVQGWAFALDAPMTSLTAVAPEGGRVDVAERLFRYPRPDVAGLVTRAASYDSVPEAGFVAYFELDSPSRLPDGWVFELRDAAGGSVETRATAISGDPSVVRTMVLQDLKINRRGNEALREHHVLPAITRLQEAHERTVRISDAEDLGLVPVTPLASVIVPLYRRIDFLEHQMAHFADDGEMAGCELIYVLDSPEMRDQFLDYAAQVFALYRMPFRVVVLNQNGGFSLANNLAASVARGERLLLLNSDVIPVEPGWLGRMIDAYDATPRIGALGPKLLFEDDGLQHAGMFFRRQPGGREWWNEHFFKGMHRDLPAANVARAVPALTAACLLTDADLYQRLGGLRGIYVQGDYEDSDFCLRVREARLECWYLPQVELYHLEGQSYPGETRELSGLYNRWLHTHMWNDAIQSAMEDFEAAEAHTKAIAGASGLETSG